MFKKTIHALLRHRHPWRTMQFDELAEIYMSMSIRSFGIGLIGIFVPIYLYKSGVDLPAIFMFFAFFFLFRIPVSIVSAYVIGRIGPKHAIALSTLFFLFFLFQLLSFTAVMWPLWFLALSYTLPNGLFFIAYNTDISKIKHANHGGKELGWLYIFERAGAALGPLVGGLLATFVHPSATIVAAIAVLGGSLVPLLRTKEPVKLHQKISFKGFPYYKHRRDFIALSASGAENFASVAVWPLYVAVAIFVEDTYAKLGGVLAIAMVVSMFSAYSFGKLVDSRKGIYLLRYGVVMNAVTHILRAFTRSSGAAVAISILNEPITLAYRMPLTKSLFDEADSEEGYRIVYCTSVEISAALSKTVMCTGLYVAAQFYNSTDVLRSYFVVISVVSLGILLQKFASLQSTVK